MKRTMASFRVVHFVLFFLLAMASSAFSSSISFDKLLESHMSTDKPPKPCPVDFEHKNYTDMTSRCKGPHYQPKPCCDALAKMACPHMDEINDLSNDCAIAMFGNINYHGHYPTGLFARLCSEGKNGLKCE